MSTLEVVTATSANDGTSPKTQAVSCTGSKKALGGGGSIASSGNRDPAIEDSQPTGGPPARVGVSPGSQRQRVC